jgi:hypothetical protein
VNYIEIQGYLSEIVTIMNSIKLPSNVSRKLTNSPEFKEWRKISKQVVDRNTWLQDQINK